MERYLSCCVVVYWYRCTDDHLLKCMIQNMDLPTCRFEMYLRLYMFSTSIPKIMIFIRAFEKQDFWNISIISIKGEEDLIFVMLNPITIKLSSLSVCLPMNIGDVFLNGINWKKPQHSLQALGAFFCNSPLYISMLMVSLRRGYTLL